jgi:hypothetical protein
MGAAASAPQLSRGRANYEMCRLLQEPIACVTGQDHCAQGPMLAAEMGCSRPEGAAQNSQLPQTPGHKPTPWQGCTLPGADWRGLLEEHPQPPGLRQVVKDELQQDRHGEVRGCKKRCTNTTQNTPSLCVLCPLQVSH